MGVFLSLRIDKQTFFSLVCDTKMYQRAFGGGLNFVFPICSHQVPNGLPTYSPSSQCLGNMFPIAPHFFVLYKLPNLLSSSNPHRVGEYWDLYDSMFRNTFFFFLGGHEPIKEAHLQEKLMDMEGHLNFLISFTLSIYMDINSTLVDLFYTYKQSSLCSPFKEVMHSYKVCAK